ncbi:MAG TPA: hypothetical protein VF503_00385 [Sphingobium sp.]|uniref:hypothetical protein n=1 Tax=Sphingobium sp. TaxID=1912891 RepID=UPI002ED2B646
MDRRLIVIALGVVLGGTAGGFALGGFATGHGTKTASTDSFWGSDASTADAPAAPVEPATAAATGPENYVCHGCGQTLAEKRASQSYGGDYASSDVGFGGQWLAPLPPRHLAPDEQETQMNLPDPDAGHAPY